MASSKSTNSATSSPATPPHLVQARPFSRRSFLRLAAMSAAGLSAAGLDAACASLPVRPEATQAAKIQLVYQDWRTDWFPAIAREMLAEFQATHPNISVFYVPDPENLEEKMLADMQAGTAADVFQGCCTHFPTWAQKGYTLDLRPYVSADLDKATIDDWDPIQYKSLFTRDGLQFGLPKYHGALALYYNKDVMEELGVPFPDGSWTYDDYLRAMRRLTYDRNEDNRTDVWGSMIDISWDRLQVHVNGWGGHLVDPDDPTHCMMSRPEAKQAFEWIRARLWDDKVMPSNLKVQNVGTQQAFINGQLAMVEDGSWSLKAILSAAPFRVGVAPFPAGPVRRVTLTTTDGFGIYAHTRYPEAAWELVKFLISKDYGRAMARAHFLQPARASLVDEWVGYVRSQYPKKAADLDVAAFAEGHLKGYSVTTEIFANMADAARIAADAWDKIFTYGEATVDRMDEACFQIEQTQKRVATGG